MEGGGGGGGRDLVYKDMEGVCAEGVVDLYDVMFHL